MSTEPTVATQASSPCGIQAAASTHVGLVREHNEDSFALVPEQDLYIVSDGMGGRAAGDTASLMVVEALPRLLRQRLGNRPEPDIDLAQELRSALLDLSQAVGREAERRVGLAGMGATVVLALAHGDQLTIAHMGDSRAYRLHAGHLEQLTEDHSVVAILLRRGEIGPDDVDHHPAKGQITRYVGMRAVVDPDICTVDFPPGARLMLCTDGLHGVVPDTTIMASLAEQDGPADACEQLVEAALAAGGPDNVTVLVADRHPTKTADTHS